MTYPPLPPHFLLCETRIITLRPGGKKEQMGRWLGQSWAQRELVPAQLISLSLSFFMCEVGIIIPEMQP